MCANSKGNALLAGHINGDIYMFFISATGQVSKVRHLLSHYHILNRDRTVSQHTRLYLMFFRGESLSSQPEMITGSCSMMWRVMSSRGSITLTMRRKKWVYFYLFVVDCEYLRKTSSLVVDVVSIILTVVEWHNDVWQEYTCGEFSPSGQSVILGSFNRFRTFSYNTRRQVWEDSGVVDIQNMYTLTALSWKRDGSKVNFRRDFFEMKKMAGADIEQLVVGTLTGGLEMYDACLKRFKYKGKFEMVYVSPSQVIVKRLSNGEKIMLNSLHGHEITKVTALYNSRIFFEISVVNFLWNFRKSSEKFLSDALQPYLQRHNDVCRSMYIQTDISSLTLNGRSSWVIWITKKSSSLKYSGNWLETKSFTLRTLVFVW